MKTFNLGQYIPKIHCIVDPTLHLWGRYPAPRLVQHGLGLAGAQPAPGDAVQADGAARQVLYCAALYCTVLTVQLARFTRAHMFGPGTACRCATCVRLPDTCQWGGGPYAGTLLLYAQEMALNVLWSDREYEVELQTINRRNFHNHREGPY